MLFGRKTQEFALPRLEPATPVVHTHDLDMFRARNLVEISRLMDDAPKIGELALDQAKELSRANGFNFSEIQAEVSYDQISGPLAS